MNTPFPNSSFSPATATTFHTFCVSVARDMDREEEGTILPQPGVIYNFKVSFKNEAEQKTLCQMKDSA